MSSLINNSKAEEENRRDARWQGMLQGMHYLKCKFSNVDHTRICDKVYNPVYLPKLGCIQEYIALMTKGRNGKLSQLILSCPTRIYSRGQGIECGWEGGDKVCFIESGTVQQTYVSRQGGSLIVHFYQEESFFPPSFWFEKGDGRFRYEATTKTVIRLLPGGMVRQLFWEDPELLAQHAKELSRGFWFLAERLSEANCGDAYRKVLVVLTYLTEVFSEQNGKVMRITHERIGELAGLARETVSVQMGLMRERKLIEQVGRGRIKLDHAAIAREIGLESNG